MGKARRDKRELRDWLRVPVRQPDGTFLSPIEQCEQRAPNRAHAALAVIDLALDAPPQRLPGNRGHHQSIAHARRQHPRKMVLDAKRKQARSIREPPEGHGIAEGLRLFAEHLAPQIQAARGLMGEEHRAALVEYLVGAWGEIAHACPDHIDLPGYHEWRERSRDRLAGRG